MSKKICCIYKISSIKKPDKVYIGSTYWFQHRKWRHLRCFQLERHPNKYLLSHVLKYGVQDLLFEVIEIIDDKSMLKDAEQKYIDALRPRFNLLPTAYSNRGFKHSEETKNKIGEKHKGKKISAETKAKISAARKGKKKSLAERERMSEYRKGRKRKPFTDEWKRNMSLAHLRRNKPTNMENQAM